MIYREMLFDKKDAISAANKRRAGIPKPKKECPHCNQLIPIHLFNRLHNDNCKFKK